MAQAQQPAKFKVVAPCGTENEFDDKDKAEDGIDTHEALCEDCGTGDCEIQPLDEDMDAHDNDHDESDATDEPEEPDTPEFDDRDEPGTEPTEVIEPDTAPAINNPEDLPKINPVEDTARQVISQLNTDDMHRLVWDPEADPADVPYDVRGLPYEKPEPSAEAFDLFAGIIEGARNVQYSVEDVEFEETDKTFECTVAIEKQTDQGNKRLVGIKTRQKSRTTGIDHWRERIYSKARRNALKQDIPPTMVSSLLARYRELEG